MPTARCLQRELRTTPAGGSGRAAFPADCSRACPRSSIRASGYGIGLIVTRRPENSYFAPDSRDSGPSMSATRRAPRIDAVPRPARTSARPCA